MGDKLLWQSMKAILPHIEQWGATSGFASFIITHDTGCRPDDKFHGRYAVSAKMPGSLSHLGVYDTLREAKEAAELKLVRTMQ